MSDKNKEALDALSELADWANKGVDTCTKGKTVPDIFSIKQTIRAALSSPRVPVIDGLEEALNKYSFDMPDISDYETVGEYLDDEASYRKASSIVEKAARAYAALSKIQKVDLDEVKIEWHHNLSKKNAHDIYNEAIDDIKAKYGELYAEVKE